MPTPAHRRLRPVLTIVLLSLAPALAGCVNAPTDPLVDGQAPTQVKTGRNLQLDSAGGLTLTPQISAETLNLAGGAVVGGRTQVGTASSPSEFVLHGRGEFFGPAHLVGDMDLDGKVDVRDDAIFQHALNVLGAANAGSLDVSGATTLRSALSVLGKATVGTAAAPADLAVTGNVVAGDITGDGVLTIADAATFGNTISVLRDADIDGRLDVAEAARFAKTVAILGATTVGTPTAPAGLDVSGPTHLLGDLDLDGKIDVSDFALFRSGLQLLGDADLNGKLDVQEATTLQKSLDVLGKTTIGTALTPADLNATGFARVGKDLKVVGKADVTGDTVLRGILQVLRDTDLDGKLDVADTVSLQKTLSVVGQTTTGALDVGGASRLRGDLNLDGKLNAGDSVIVGKTLNVVGATTLATLNAGATTASSLRVTGASVLGATTTGALTAGATTATTLGVTGATTLGQTTTGALSAGSTTATALTVTGASTLGATTTGALAAGTTTLSSLTVTGGSNLNTLGVTGASTLGTLAAQATTLGSLAVNGATSTASLTVTGATTLGSTTTGTLTSGATTASSLAVTGVSTLGSTTTGTLTAGATSATGLTVTGATTLGSTTTGVLIGGTTTLSSLTVTGASTLGTVTAGTTALGSLAVTGATNLGSTTTGALAAGATTASSLAVTGTSTLGATTTGTLASGATTASGLTVTGATTLGSTTTGALTGGATTLTALTVLGGTTLNTLTATGATTLADLAAQATTLGSLTVAGATTLGTVAAGDTSTEDLTADSLAVSGDTTLAGLTAGTTTLGDLLAQAITGSSLEIDGAVTFGDLVAENTTLASLAVSGDTTLADLTAAAIAGDSLSVAGQTTLADLAAGASSLSSLTVTGATSLDALTAGASTLGDLTAQLATLSGLAVNGASTLGDLSAGAVTGDSLDVRGTTTLAALIAGDTILGNLTAENTTLASLTVLGATDLQTLVAGASTLADLLAEDTTLSSLTVTGASTLDTLDAGAATVSTLTATGASIGLLDVAGTTTLAELLAGDTILGNLTAENTTLAHLSVLGITNLADLLAGASTLASLTVSGATTLDALTAGTTTLGQLTAGATSLSGLDVSGVTTLAGLVAGETILGNLTAENITLASLEVAGITNLAGLVAGATNLQSLAVAGDLSFGGTLTGAIPWSALTQPGLSLAGCTNVAADKLVFDATNGVLICANDIGGENAATFDAGEGLLLTGNVFSVNFTAVQRRVTTGCAATAPILAILPNGSVVCDDNLARILDEHGDDLANYVNDGAFVGDSIRIGSFGAIRPLDLDTLQIGTQSVGHSLTVWGLVDSITSSTGVLSANSATMGLLDVGGTSTLHGSVFVGDFGGADKLTVNGTLHVYGSGESEFYGPISVLHDTFSTFGSLDVGREINPEALQVYGTLNTTDLARLASLDVTGATTLQGTQIGNATSAANLAIYGDVIALDGTFDDLTAAGLTVSGQAIFEDAATFQDGLLVLGSLIANGAEISTLQIGENGSPGLLTVYGQFNATDLSGFDDGLEVHGLLHLFDGLFLTGDGMIDGNLSFSGTLQDGAVPWALLSDPEAELAACIGPGEKVLWKAGLSGLGCVADIQPVGTCALGEAVVDIQLDGDVVCSMLPPDLVAGSGLRLSGNEISLDTTGILACNRADDKVVWDPQLDLLACAAEQMSNLWLGTLASNTTLESPSNAFGLDVTFSPDGRAYLEYGAFGPTVDVCENAACTARTTLSYQGDPSQIEIAFNETLPRISYPANGISIDICDDVVCLSKASVTVVSPANPEHALAVLRDGRPVVLGTNNTNTFLASCDDTLCTTATVTDLGSARNGAFEIFQPHDGGLVLVAGFEFARCATVDCLGVTWEGPSIAFGSDAAAAMLPDERLFFASFDASAVYVMVCAAACETPRTIALDGLNFQGLQVEVGPGGVPVLGGELTVNGFDAERWLAFCADLECSSVEVTSRRPTSPGIQLEDLVYVETAFAISPTGHFAFLSTRGAAGAGSGDLIFERWGTAGLSVLELEAGFINAGGLHVDGNASVNGVLDALVVRSGEVDAASVYVRGSGLAWGVEEQFYGPGTVVAAIGFDEATGAVSVEPVDSTNKMQVIGVIVDGTAGGIMLSSTVGNLAVASVGPVIVELEAGPGVAPGDLLAAGENGGAVVCNEPDNCRGYLIGKVIEDHGNGEALVWLFLG